MRPQDYVIYRYDCNIYADYTTLNKKSGKWTTHHQSIHNTGWEAIEALIEYCKSQGIEVETPGAEWKKYFEEMDQHLAYMIEKKGTESESAWQMRFSCDAPNEPGYTRANND